MTKESTCCFTGHRKLYKPVEELIPPLKAAIDDMYSRGVRNFCCGGALGFDTLAAQMVLELKKTRDDVRLVLILPCPEQANRWAGRDIAEYERIKSLADEVIITSPHYTSFCMHVRNHRLVDESAYCIAYLVVNKGGTASTVDYAAQQGVKTVNIA